MKAFPNISTDNYFNGMDLRDYFAIHFAQSQIELIKDEQFNALETFTTSYKLADIMMKAREMKQNIFCSKCHRIPSQCCCSSAKELTDEEIDQIIKQHDWYSKTWVDMVRSIESVILKKVREQ